MKTIIHSVVALCNSLKSGRCLKIWAGRNILSQKYSPLPNKLIQVLTILLKLLLFVFKGLLGFMKVFLFLQQIFSITNKFCLGSITLGFSREKTKKSHKESQQNVEGNQKDYNLHEIHLLFACMKLYIDHTADLSDAVGNGLPEEDAVYLLDFSICFICPRTSPRSSESRFRYIVKADAVLSSYRRVISRKRPSAVNSASAEVEEESVSTSAIDF